MAEIYADRETTRLLHAAATWIAGAVADDPSGEPWLMTRTLLNELISHVDALGGWPPPGDPASMRHQDAIAGMTKDIAVVCSEKVYRIREAVAAEPRSPLSDRILRILNDTKGIGDGT